MTVMTFRNKTKGYNKAIHVSDNVSPIKVLTQLKEGNDDSWKFVSKKTWEPKQG